MSDCVGWCCILKKDKRMNDRVMIGVVYNECGRSFCALHVLGGDI